MFRTMQIQWGLVHSFQYFATVMSSAMLFICMAPSPTSAMTGRSGNANFAAIAYGTAAPIDASPPESEQCMPRFTFKSRAYQLATDPESLVTMAFAGTRVDNSQTVRCGFTPATLVASARFSSVFHQSSIQPSMRLRHERSDFCSSRGSKARSVSALSPTRFTSIG
ncbi:hypothetical protein AWB74_08813 [Caballeronia arvi]|uniref:Uncharacterized protein n=1 Tax=Caballeronia arvi TaxID=1777135 RepID=A0A158L784_9BURK|nr:hypothetical protein AWB74_08813 [Caballeronia arvi]